MRAQNIRNALKQVPTYMLLFGMDNLLAKSYKAFVLYQPITCGFVTWSEFLAAGLF
jgi:hypothetical protein